MHPVTRPEQIADKPPEISDFPDLIADQTVAFAMCKVVPDIIDEVQPKSGADISVRYGGSIAVENMMQIALDDLIDEPTISITGKGVFTMMLVDPDAPTPRAPRQRSWLLWLVKNIPATDLARGEEVVGYMAPDPQGKKHRYTFLLFRQRGQIKPKAPHKRSGFQVWALNESLHDAFNDEEDVMRKRLPAMQVREFAKAHDLGNPVAGLFFYASADE